MKEQWVELRVTTPEGAEELVAELLHGGGSAGTVLEDTLSEVSGALQRPGYTVVSGFFSAEAELPAVELQLYKELQQLYLRLDLEVAPVIQRRPVVAADWAESWQQYYRVNHIGGRLVVVPAWEDYEPENNEVVIRINPGMAFGSGTHDSTRFALRALEQILKGESEILAMLDVGTGTGILALAALKLGCHRATAIDVNPEACARARENAEFNGELGRVRVLEKDLRELAAEPGAAFPLVAANLLPDLLLDLGSALKQVTAPGGRLVLSGVILAREEELTRKFVQLGFRRRQRFTGGNSDWVALVLARPESDREAPEPGGGGHE